MLLGTRNFTQGDTRRVVLDYSGWLTQGVILETIMVSVPAGTTSTVQGAVLTEDYRHAIFYVTGGVLNENFTVAIQITDSAGETVNDTIVFTVVAP
jgi:hypothetical protein